MKKQTQYPKSFKYATKQHLFIAGIWHYDGAFTYCNEIKFGMHNEKPLQLAKSVKDLKQRMALNPVYEDRHFRKVDMAYEYFLQRLKEVKITLPASVADIP